MVAWCNPLKTAWDCGKGQHAGSGRAEDSPLRRGASKDDTVIASVMLVTKDGITWPSVAQFSQALPGGMPEDSDLVGRHIQSMFSMPGLD